MHRKLHRIKLNTSQKEVRLLNKKVQPHIQLANDLAVDKVLLPGDPARVERLKKWLDAPKELTFNREYRSLIGSYKGTSILVMSTGMGGPSTGIGVEELANIGVKYAIRIGSCGALQPEIELGDLLVATAAVRDEGTTKAYMEEIYPAVPDYQLLSNIKQALETGQFPSHFGLVRSHDSFYTDNEAAIDAYWSNKGVLGADMETSSLFVIGGLRGMRTASILNVVVTAEGNLESGINKFVNTEEKVMEGENHQIKVALEALASIT